MEPTISVYLDTRRAKTGKQPDKPQSEKTAKLYPVKLRVYHNYETRFYPTGIDATQEAFTRSYLSTKPRQEHKALKGKIAAIEARANALKQDIRIFSFTQFEKVLLRPTGSATDVLYRYDQIIKERADAGRINTSSSYESAINSIGKYLKSKGLKKLNLSDVTQDFLKGYERWMKGEGNSETTVGIYLRTLRAIFNTAILDHEVDESLYPFGKSRYQIPAGRNIKKALSREDLRKLFEHKSNSDLINKARSFWFFSYSTNGINIKDIAELKYKNISGSTISFVRAKTINTTRGKTVPIIAPLTPFAKLVIEKYGNQDRSKENYIFPILSATMSEKEKVRAIQRFTRFINQHIKILAKSASVATSLSTYTARHSFTTMAVQNGASLEYIQDSLGHKSISTTMQYWAGFGESIKKEISDKLMQF